jgi:hypothetical protein
MSSSLTDEAPRAASCGGEGRGGEGRGGDGWLRGFRFEPARGVSRP